MNIYETRPIGERVAGNPYVGRGIVIGRTESGDQAVAAYFIMGRSANSRNRVFVKRDEALYTEAFDSSKLTDPSLIIYAAVRRYNNKLIVTNGDQTDTIVRYLEHAKSFQAALNSRGFEPDMPNFTPRISGMLTFLNGGFTYEMSILKSADATGSACCRYHFAYPALAGLGHFIHTYVTDGDPIPTFQGEPERIFIPDSIDVFANDLWNNLDAANRISLYVVYTDLATGKQEERLINQNQRREAAK